MKKLLLAFAVLLASLLAGPCTDEDKPVPVSVEPLPFALA